MGQKVTMGAGLDEVDVDLFGYDFKALPETRSLTLECQPLERKLDEAQDPDEVIAVVGEILDIRLKPAGGAKKKPSTVVSEKWEADAFTPAALTTFLAELRAAQFAPPT